MLLKKLKGFFKQKAEKKEAERAGIITVNDINVYYEIHGKGTPLLLIEGLGYASWMWFKQLPAFSKKHTVVAFDNRGVGRTDKPDGAYSIQMMADDGAALLQALDIRSADVLGVSMGGFIAQELALRYPRIVKKLVLVSTSSGFRKEIFKGFEMWNDFMTLWGFNSTLFDKGDIQSVPPTVTVPEEAMIREGLSKAFTKEYLLSNKDDMDKIVKLQMEFPQPPYAWQRQFEAGMNFNADDRISDIRNATLVVAGREDSIVLPIESRKLAEKIPNARYVELEYSGHLLFIKEADKFNKIVLDFLEEN